MILLTRWTIPACRARASVIVEVDQAGTAQDAAQDPAAQGVHADVFPDRPAPSDVETRSATREIPRGDRETPR